MFLGESAPYRVPRGCADSAAECIEPGKLLVDVAGGTAGLLTAICRTLRSFTMQRCGGCVVEAVAQRWPGETFT
jgi:hypothetical protein